MSGRRSSSGVEPGENVVLRSFEPDLGAVDFCNARFAGADDSFDILELRAEDELDESAPMPDSLVPQEALDVSGVEDVRRFELGSRDINDPEMDMGRIDQRVPLDATEVWEIENRAGIPQQLPRPRHQLPRARVRRRATGRRAQRAQGHGPGAPGETVRVAIRFSDYADPSTLTCSTAISSSTRIED